MPSWFALGLDVYDLGDTQANESEVLSLDPNPRWFCGVPRQLSVAEFDRRRRASNHVRQEAPRIAIDPESDRRWTATSPPLPAHLSGLALTDHGASLALHVRALEPSGDVELQIALHAAGRLVWRETEHRSTNRLPFLIGLYADGQAVRRPSLGSAKFGGISRFVKLVTSGDTRRWVVRVARTSISSLLGGAAPDRLGFVVAFSERQHATYALGDGARPSPDTLLDPPFGQEQIVIRSQVAFLRWSP